MDKKEEKGTPLLSFDYLDDSDEEHKFFFVQWFLCLWRWLRKSKNAR
jgi:hypothetical protein